IAHMRSHAGCDEYRRAWRTGDIEEMLQFRAGADHQAREGQLRQRRPQSLHFLAKSAATEGLRENGAAARQTARGRGMIVGEGRGWLELESGFFFEERHCL